MILKNARIVSSTNIIERGWIKIENQKITSINEGDYFENKDSQIIDCYQQTIIPGFIDLHTHGGYGYSFMNPETLNQDLTNFSQAVLKEGTTAFLLGTVADSMSTIKNVSHALNQYLTHQQNAAEVMGIYLEGPFINPLRKGAHELSYLTNPNTQWIQEWKTKNQNLIKIVAYAPELNQDFSQFLIQEKIIPSFAHSNATAHETQQAINHGVQHVTHLYNAMAPFNHREPGPIPIILKDPNISVELICDGIHVALEVLDLTYKVKGTDKIITITDSAVAKGQPDGFYKLGSLPIQKQGHKLTLKNDPQVIAGSVSTMIDSFKRWLLITNHRWKDCVKMTATNAAQLLQLKNIGDIQVGYQADLLILDQNHDIKTVIKNGALKFRVESKKMPKMILHKVPDEKSGAQFLEQLISHQIQSKPDLVLGLITGSTPIATYNQLASDSPQKTDWSKVKTFNLDEYIGLSTHDNNSYHYFMYDHLFNKINIKKENVHIPKGTGDLAVNVLEYNSLLAQHPIDLQLLGLGENGHIGFNEPGSLITDQTRIVELTPETIQANQRFFASVEDVPTQAITMGISDILKAKNIVLVAYGKKKSQAIKQLIEGEMNSQWPCTYLKGHANLQIIADEEACSLLAKEH